jgi:hypothetical protein
MKTMLNKLSMMNQCVRNMDSDYERQATAFSYNTVGIYEF